MEPIVPDKGTLLPSPPIVQMKKLRPRKDQESGMPSPRCTATVGSQRTEMETGLVGLSIDSRVEFGDMEGEGGTVSGWGMVSKGQRRE